MVPHAGPIHGPGVDVIGVGAHDNIAEHPIDGESQIRVSVRRIQVVFIVAHGLVQPG